VGGVLWSGIEHEIRSYLQLDQKFDLQVFQFPDFSFRGGDFEFSRVLLIPK